MSRQNIRQRWLQLHRFLGLFLLILSLPIGITGSLNVYYRELDRALNPSLFTPNASGRPLPLKQILQNIQGPILWLVLPDPYWPVLQVHQKRGQRTWATFLDPVSGQILGERDEEAALMPTLYQLHQNLLLRPYWGEELVGIVGLALAFSTLSGLWLWRPKPGRFWKSVTIRKNQNLYRTGWDTHNAVGFWTSLILLAVAFSGAAMIFPRPLQSVLRASQLQPRSVTHHEPKPADDPDAILAAALGHRPHDHPTYLILPNADLNTWCVALRPNHYHGRAGSLTTLYVDPWTNQIVQERSPATWNLGDRILDHQFTLHNGSLGGDLGRFLVFLSGFAFPLLGISGAYQWWFKRRRRSSPVRRVA
ncbi:hypothetical protein ABS71_13920 [bacterium SCN 62-11]|nr:MAG: hypothetical protein ABS71_13920 [bacterium SCN 62-11]